MRLIDVDLIEASGSVTVGFFREDLDKVGDYYALS